MEDEKPPEEKQEMAADEAETKMSEEEEQDSEEDELKSVKLIESANLVAERLEKANNHFEKLLSKQEALQIENTLSGQADVTKPKKKESPSDYAAKVMRGEI